ncbi:MAG: O-methyltransferase [Ruminococcaceae bacterium]|nr:O-methyltransferase [Oscillospiraceae bacterium]
MEQNFLDELIPDRGEFLTELRRKSALEESYAPIVQKSTEQLIVTLLKLIKPKRVLEVGTAVGYSAILMADNLPDDSTIVTIERYKKHADIAVDNVFASGYEKKIKVVEGEAAEVLHWLDGSFDFIFLDAAKGQYIEFLPDILRLLKPGGVLLSDNILYHGMVEDEEKVERRKITIVKRLHMYLEEIMSNKQLTTSIIPIGDGVALSVKK